MKNWRWRECEVCKFDYTTKSWRDYKIFVQYFWRKKQFVSYQIQVFEYKKKKQENADFVSFAENVNQQCDRFNLKDLSIAMFKCLAFV